ncbi:hypothetical protein SAMN02787144_1022108 [Streptomyces atratus]|uniref:Uncharacterized protein n=1 Tax=Streptomyces atratus TaxID=1893 RepID=A0A1K2ET57_STRAR|nr:hypothetical protein SAMN02787144_1022108 [Streptomyces atratus]
MPQAHRPRTALSYAHRPRTAAPYARPCREPPYGKAQISPCRIAYATACDRFRNCNLVITECSTFFMVRSE